MSTADDDNTQRASQAGRLETPRDEALFKQLPQRGECDICMLTLPLLAKEQRYQSCCGKMLCFGCIYAAFMSDDRELCPFCRIPVHTSDGEGIERLKKRVEAEDANAIYQLGCKYYHGDMGLPQDRDKGMELWFRAGELGCAQAHHCVAMAYRDGNGVERDEQKAKHYCELAAMRGYADARHNLGSFEGNVGNIDGAMKHWMIAAGGGNDLSLKCIRICFTNGHATKDDFEKALRAHKEAKDEMKSDQRDKAAAVIAARGQN